MQHWEIVCKEKKSSTLDVYLDLLNKKLKIEYEGEKNKSSACMSKEKDYRKVLRNAWMNFSRLRGDSGFCNNFCVSFCTFFSLFCFFRFSEIVISVNLYEI